MNYTYNIIIKRVLPFAAVMVAFGVMLACTRMDDVSLPEASKGKQKMDFNILVTRDGEAVSPERSGITTRGGNFDESSNLATMDPDIPFGLIGIDYEHETLVLDNAKVGTSGGSYSGWFDNYLWEASNVVSFSAYYPYVDEVSYGLSYENYSIPYSIEDTEAGPLVSKTVEKAIDQLNMVPLVFQHITNDIGFKICDVTPAPELQGLIHLRKLTATNVASSGIFTNDIQNSTGTWHRQAYYRKVVVFEGDAKVGVGSENEKFVGYETLEDRLKDSHRYYSIPDDIEMGKQCVEVVYDVESFTLGGYTYSKLEGQTAKYMLYGLLPNNVFVYGKQYTFHIGLDLSSVYKQITFTPSVSEWETKIYENNDDF